MNLPAALPTHPTAQQTPVQAVDVHDHELFGLLNLGHGVRFQAQLFSDKSFYKHLGPFPSSFSGKQLRRIVAGRGAVQLPVNWHLLLSQRASTAVTLFGEEPILPMVAGSISAARMTRRTSNP